MSELDKDILEQVIDASSDAVTIVRLDHPDWPVALANAAFADVGGDEAVDKPFAEVIETLLGRDIALEISESLRSRQETSFPVEIAGRERLLVLKPVDRPGQRDVQYCAVFWREGAARGTAATDSHQALLKAKRRIRDLTREDVVTGLLNERAFRDILQHDWAVASREKGTLALVLFVLDEFDAYIEVFGRHASDSCLRRVGQAIRRCLRRASDVVARLDDNRLVVLSHSSDEDGVRAFAERIATAVRELGLHHPRSTSGRFVTVSHHVLVVQAGTDRRTAKKFLSELLAAAER